jgi:16S rRNA G966 N2-methylase RsmD
LNSVRIIGGQFRRRVLRFPDSEGLRPTPDRVRETLFNWLGQELMAGTASTSSPAAAPWVSRRPRVARRAW